MNLRAIYLVPLLFAASFASVAQPPSHGTGHYVAMGSSFAAGPGIGATAETGSGRCMRSPDNYANQLARRMKLELTDVSCSGARIDHVLGPWGELPPQINALRADTRLVTVTVGGNDVAYVGELISASCAKRQASGLCASLSAANRKPDLSQSKPDEERWRDLEKGLLAIANETRRRAPQAKLIFVDYLTILPKGRVCSAVPLSRGQIHSFRQQSARLARVTRKIAKIAGAEVIRASSLSARHHACASKPWMTGFDEKLMPYHPNLAGMSAIANAIYRLLGRQSGAGDS